jgi:hypothetical protein
MFDLRSRAGIAGFATGATLLALPVVAVGQVPVVDQVVGGVTETAQRLARAPVPPVTLPAPVAKPAPPAPVPALPAPPSPGPAASAPAPAPAPRAAAAPAVSAGDRTPPSPPAEAKASGNERGGATARAASGEGASEAQSHSAGDQGTGATDVEIATADSGDAGGPAALPFTGLQLVLLGMAGLAALAGGALLRRAT